MKKSGLLDSFTKVIVGIILVNAILWVWCSYGLAFLGRYEIAENLSETAVKTILGTVITYGAKSLFENVNKHGINLPVATGKTNTKKQDY